MPIVGDVLAGRYRIDAPIGAGGMATVYRAYDLRLERDVAVKVLLPNLAADPILALRFQREALALAATAHPSVVKVFDAEPGDPATGREPFYVMEWCEGGSLADRLAGHGKLDAGELVAAVAAVAAGLADLHRRGFVHRDVKPHNILFDQGRARLADFGLARSDERSDLTALTMSGATVGTLAYLAPELTRGAPATPASDVYALGVVAFQGLTGRLPRPAGSLTELVDSQAETAPTVSSVAPALGTAFDGPVASALSIDPLARPDPHGLAARLTDALAESGPRSGATASAVAPVVARVGSSPAGPGDATVTDLRPVTVIPTTGSTRSQPDARRPALFALGALGIALLVLIALSSLPGGNDGRATADPIAGAAATPGATPSPTASPAPTPGPTPTASPTPTPTPDDPAAEAFTVLDRIDEAIEALADEDGIRDRDLEALRRRAGDVREALEAGDYEEAIDRTARLDEEVDRADDRAQGEAMDRLKDAVSQLDEAIPSG